MYYVQDEKKLRDAFNILAAHSDDVKQYYLAGLKPRVLAFDKDEDRLMVLFALANADRQGTGEDNVNLIEAVHTFNRYLSEGVISDLRRFDEPETAHRCFLEKKLCDIPGMDQKTANLFLKYLWMFQDEFDLGSLYNWKSWGNCLAVPLDLWVLRLMGNRYMSVCNEAFERDFGSKKKETRYVSPSFKRKEYLNLQSDIAEIARSVGHPAIVLDSLWFVGNKYCQYWPILCSRCWLGNQCQRCEKFDFDGGDIKTKSEKAAEKAAEEAEFKKMKVMVERWLSNYPGKTRDDFANDRETPEFREWLAKQEEVH